MSGADTADRYHGLINQGSTCYLNSVLQVLFMTEDFRTAVKKNSKQKNRHPEFLDQYLNTLFDDLQEHEAQTFNITQKLDIENVYEQRDAADYFERVLRMTSTDASQIFHGQLANKTTCSKGHIQTDGDAPFWHLPLPLVNSCSEDYSVVKGIEEFFKPSDFCGENRLYCDQCGDKVDATMRDEIKHQPDVLCLLLKRFEFNYNYMSYIKINCSVEFPKTLQIPECQTYELYASVDHFGDLRGGHYTATIKIQEEHGDRWYQFDDTRVTELDYQQFQFGNTKRSQTTYLLFYRKKKDTGTQDRKRKQEKGEETDMEHNPKAPKLREAEGSPNNPCNVDPLDKEQNEDKETTGSDGLDQNNTKVDDYRKENLLKDNKSHEHGNTHSDHSDTLNMISVTNSSDNDVQGVIEDVEIDVESSSDDETSVHVPAEAAASENSETNETSVVVHAEAAGSEYSETNETSVVGSVDAAGLENSETNETSVVGSAEAAGSENSETNETSMVVHAEAAGSENSETNETSVVGSVEAAGLENSETNETSVVVPAEEAGSEYTKTNETSVVGSEDAAGSKNSETNETSVVGSVDAAGSENSETNETSVVVLAEAAGSECSETNETTVVVLAEAAGLEYSETNETSVVGSVDAAGSENSETK
nr:ubiquitin carboxyl-terminal hydrolase 17-like protein B [Maylandia zebra]